MRFRASPLMVAVALGLVNASVLTAEVPGRSNVRGARAEPVVQPDEVAAIEKAVADKGRTRRG